MYFMVKNQNHFMAIISSLHSTVQILCTRDFEP